MKNLLKIDLDQRRIFGLDILRALAILFVIIGHGRFILPKNFQFIHKLIVFDGVSIFFVLSGFLIGGILIKMIETKEVNGNLLVYFWIRRWFRTLPNYFLILITLAVLNIIFTDDFSLWQIRSYFIFSQNLFSAHPAFFPEAWSLSIEEWFYLLIPILIFSLILFFKFPNNRSVIITAVSILVIITCFRLIRYTNITIESNSQWDLLFRKQVFTRLDSLMFGVIGAYVQFYYKEHWIRNKNMLLFSGISLFVIYKVIYLFKIFPTDGLYHCVFSFSLTSLATMFLLPFLSGLKKGKGIAYRFFTYISLISYSMYLLNLSIVHKWIIGSIEWNHLTGNTNLIVFLKYGLYWFLTIVLSILIYKYFEVPMMKLRDHKIIKKLVPVIKASGGARPV